MSIYTDKVVMRGSTPILTFTLPFDVSAAEVLNIAFSQRESLVFEKELCDCDISGNVVTVHLSQDDTIKLDCHFLLEIQLRPVICGEALVSNIIVTDVGRILKEGCL